MIIIFLKCKSKIVIEAHKIYQTDFKAISSTNKSSRNKFNISRVSDQKILQILFRKGKKKQQLCIFSQASRSIKYYMISGEVLHYFSRRVQSEKGMCAMTRKGY